MRLLIAQTNPIRGDIKHNLDTLDRLCEQAVLAGVDIVALPELALTGYNIFGQLEALADDGPLQHQVAALARSHGLFILFGVAQRQADGCLRNSALLIGDDGKTLASYHKRHLWDEETRHFTPGEALCVVETRLGRLGLMICYDNEFPEMARALAQSGAEVILSPTANMLPNAERQILQIRARAMDNQCFVACINRSGSEDTLHYCGHSLVAGPDGEIIGQLGSQAGSLVIDIDLERIPESQRHQNYLKDLRPPVRLVP
ncbi:MAG: carbon-nitrogen hydrolase family protein [Cobetia sp.]|jgi:predicted amidohydrolase|uniref:carbon-nitrogen hydrolase family protein n=1 Tax=Cobetia sp. TaxID=1873876 RepID=UPI003242FC3F